MASPQEESFENVDVLEKYQANKNTISTTKNHKRFGQNSLFLQ
ncbi:hypothetical protein OD91_0906 [Lutibacter sp. Hel_I_33_5]|nr:hypothetical protein OD91_0906 [Lutibacter sp. Hel_I_33_5]